MKKFSILVPVIAAATMMMGCSEYLCLAPPGTTASSKLSICHKTGKAGKFELLTIKASAAEAHIQHGDFLAPTGAKKAADCKEPVVVPPVVVPPVVVPPVVVPPVVVPPVVVPPVVVPPVVVPPVVVVPPIVVDPTGPGTSDGGGNQGGGADEDEPTNPGTGGNGGSEGEQATGGNGGDGISVFCLLNPLHIDCLP